MATKKPNKPKKAPLTVARKPALRALPARQIVAAAPVIQSPDLLAMEKVAAVKTVMRDPLLPLMGAGPMHPATGQGLMEVVAAKRSAAASPHSGRPQLAKETPESPGSEYGYVRVQVHVEDGKLSVTGIKEVPGPLAMPSAVIHGHAYEVLLGEQQVGLGSLPDVGVRRAFANRDVEGPQGKHFIINVPTFDFVARIPKGHFVTQNLPKLHIVLHKVESAPYRFTSLAPLQKQPEVKSKEVGRLTGIQLKALEPEVRGAFQKILSQTDKLH